MRILLLALAAFAARARMHLVLRRDPALAFAFHPRRDLRIDRRRAEDDGVTGAVEDRALCVPVEADRHLDGAE